MKKLSLTVFFLASFISAQTQWDLSISMGLDFKSSPSFRDYVNVNYATPGNQISSFKSSVGFAAEADYKISNNFKLGLEYNLQIDSYSTLYGLGGSYEISYNHHRPSLLAYYVIPGEGYQVKLGGGIGYRYLSLNERVISSSDYKASGVGFILRAAGNTQLSKNFYVLIGTDFRYDFTGEVSNGSRTIENKVLGEKLNMKTISFGIYLGITFTL